MTLSSSSFLLTIFLILHFITIVYHFCSISFLNSIKKRCDEIKIKTLTRRNKRMHGWAEIKKINTMPLCNFMPDRKAKRSQRWLTSALKFYRTPFFAFSFQIVIQLTTRCICPRNSNSANPNRKFEVKFSTTFHVCLDDTWFLITFRHSFSFSRFLAHDSQ